MPAAARPTPVNNPVTSEHIDIPVLPEETPNQWQDCKCGQGLSLSVARGWAGIRAGFFIDCHSGCIRSQRSRWSHRDHYELR
jgi:hypothetical protein